MQGSRGLGLRPLFLRSGHKEVNKSIPGYRYEDDRDEGEWFLYTGSGGRDLSGNKRVTNVGLLH